MGAQTFDAIIVGGSLAGLMHAVVLKSLGRKVIVLESREHDELHAEAAGLGLGPHAQRLVREYLDLDDSFAIHSTASQILRPDGTVEFEVPPGLPTALCTWSMVYELLKAKFLGPSVSGAVSVYETGVRVDRFEYDGQDSPVRVICTSRNDASERTVEAPFVIGADGARSTVRLQLQPDVKSDYAGYVAWRGYVPEAQTPDALKGVFENKLVFVLLGGHYIIAYLTPGPSGSTTPGERLFDWIWYCPADAGTSELSEIMTDTTGHRHNNTVPRGRLRNDVWEKQLSKYPLPADWDRVIRGSAEPFVTAITSFDGPSMTFCDGKILLAGEGYAQFRPHMGLSCDLAAFQALALGDVLKGEKDMDEYEKVVSEYAKEFSFRSKATGQWGFSGKWPEGYVPLFVKKDA